jgi:flagellin-specific chaperone FliS
MNMLSKGELAKKMAEKCGQTWNEIPSDVKKEIQDAIIAAFKKQAPQEQEENVDYAQLADDVCASYRGPLSKLDLKDSINYIVKMVAKKIGKTVDTLTPEELTAIQKAAKYSVWYVSEQEELTVEQEEEDTFNAYYSQDEPDYENDHHGIWLIINLMRKQGMLRAQGIEGRDNVDDGHAIDKAYDLIEQKLNDEGMWIGDDDHEAERFVSFFGEEIAAEAMKSAIHNQQSQEQEENSLDTEYFSDLEEQEAYYENFRAIAELVADQIDKENGKDIANNMDTLFAIVREVWNNNPDDLYIWDFDDVQENDCYKFFDKYYETIKNEYLKREHNNIMAATHDDLFAS